MCGLPVYDEATQRRPGPRCVTEIPLEAIAGIRKHVESYGLEVVRFGNFHIAMGEEDEDRLNKFYNGQGERQGQIIGIALFEAERTGPDIQHQLEEPGARQRRGGYGRNRQRRHRHRIGGKARVGLDWFTNFLFGSDPVQLKVDYPGQRGGMGPSGSEVPQEEKNQ